MPDCIMNVSDECTALSVEKCRPVLCPFYKDTKTYTAGVRKVYERLRSLKPEKQREIADKYYNCYMPWYENI